jgi:hypothetical protein
MADKKSITKATTNRYMTRRYLHLISDLTAISLYRQTKEQIATKYIRLMSAKEEQLPCIEIMLVTF